MRTWCFRPELGEEVCRAERRTVRSRQRGDCKDRQHGVGLVSVRLAAGGPAGRVCARAVRAAIGFFALGAAVAYDPRSGRQEAVTTCSVSVWRACSRPGLVTS